MANNKNKAMGRPSSFTQEVADEICARLAMGEPLAQICRDDHMPGLRTVSDWKDSREELAAAIARAREAGFDVIAAQCLEIANTPMEGVETTIKADGSKEVKQGDMLGHRKLQIETRLKLLAKWDPKRYGEKLAIGGADDLPPIKTMADDELAAKIALLEAKLKGNADAGA